MKERMEEFILGMYPEAKFESFYKTPWGEIQYLFYKDSDAIDPYVCVIENGEFFIIIED